MNYLLLLVALFVTAYAGRRHFLASISCLQRFYEQNSAFKPSLSGRFSSRFIYSQAKQQAGITLGVLGLAVIFTGSVMEAQTAHFYGGQSTIAGGLNYPLAVAVDGTGSVYIADYKNYRLLKETLSKGTYIEQTIVTFNSSSRANGVAVDASGNIYVTDFNANVVFKETPAAGQYVQTTIPTSTLRNPSTTIADSAGNLYITDSGNGRLLKETLSGSTYVESVIATGLNWPAGLAMDNAGSLYVSNFYQSILVKETPSIAGQYAQSTIPTGGLLRPSGIAVDASGNIYISDSGNNRLVKETLLNGSYMQSTIPTVGLDGDTGVTLDASGNIYIVNAAGNNVFMLHPGSLNFGSVATGSTSNTSSLLFVFDTAGQLGAPPTVSTQGLPNLDFAAESSGTCEISQSYNADDVCSIDVTFKPTLSGPRYGAAVLKNSSGGIITTGYLQGTGLGPQVSFAPAVQSIVTSGGLLNPRGLASDGNGNLYVADTDHNRVLKETFSGGTYSESTIASTGLLYPIGIAVDGAGNVYIGDCFHGRVLKEVPSGGSYTESTAIKNVGCALGIALDGSGDMYIAQDNSTILLEKPSSGGYIQTAIISSGIANAKGIAIDASGNLYITDGTNQKVIKETLSNGIYSAEIIPTSQLNEPRQIAVDASGNVFIADAHNGRILKETLTGGNYVESILSSGLIEADSVTVDAGGNVYIENTYYRQVVKLDYADAPGLTFAKTAVGATSSAQTIMLQNIGNSPLAFPVPASGSNPAVSANFSVDDSVTNACPQTSTNGSAAASLAPGTSCALTISFAPTATGSLQGNVVISNTNLNAANALQAIALAGTGSAASTNFVLSVPTSAVYGNPVQVSASITTDQTNNPAPNGTVAFSDQNGGLGSKTVVNGSATQSYLAPSVGSFTLNGAFSPSNTDYNKSSGQATIQITAAQLNLSANGVTRTYGAANPQLTGAIIGAVNGDNFVEAFKTSATASSPVASYPIVPSASGPNLSNYTQNVQNGALQITAAGLNITANDATRTYGAINPQFTGTMAGLVNGDNLAETFTTTATNASPVATYTIVPSISGAAASNYNPIVKNGTLTVSPAGLSVSANDATRTYGSVNPQFAGTVTGMVNGDQFTETFVTAATQSSPVKAYSIVPSAVGPALRNYNPAIHNGTLTISPATMAVRANDATRTYGAPNPAMTGTITGAVSGDAITVTYITSATGSSPVATYPITPNLAGQGLSNYTQFITNGTLTVTAAPLTATVQNVTRIYGAANPSFQGAVVGTVNHDSITETFTTSATAQSPVGSYAIKPVVAGANLAGYTPTLVEGTLTIVPAPLVATAASVERMYGTANPVLSGSLSGVVNGDTLPASYSTTAQTTDTVGHYPIMTSVTGSALSNYTLSVVPGVLAVQKASTLTTLDPQKGVTTAGATIQLQAHVVSATTGAPGGTVRFYNDKYLLGEATLQNGTAVYSTNPLPAGSSNTLTAVYQADANFLSSSSDVRSITLQGSGFTVKAIVPTMTVHAGDQAAFSLNVDPGTTGMYPGVVTFAVTGLPDGATATFSPATLAANGGNQTIAMTVQTKAQAASASGMAHTDNFWKSFPLVSGSALALVLLPLAGARRLRKAGTSMLLTLLLVLGGLAGSMALTGCGVTRNTAFPNPQPTTYVLTVTATSGGVQQTVTESLTVQP